MGLFTAVRDPGVRRKLAEACQPGSSNPSSASHIRKAAKPPTAIGILLSCAKKNGVGRQEEVAQRKPLKVSSGLFRKQKGCGPFEIPGVPDLKRLLMGQSSTYFGSTLFLACKYPLVCKSLTIFLPSSKFGRLVRRKAFLLCKNPCGAGCDGGRGSSSQRGKSPAQRNFQRKFALRRVGSAKFVVPPTTERSKVRSTPNRYNRLYRAARGARGAAAPLFRKESRGNPFEGFPLGNFFAEARHGASLRS